MRLDANSLARQDVNVRFVMASHGHARSMLARCSIVDATPTRTSPTVNQSLILESRIFTPSPNHAMEASRHRPMEIGIKPKRNENDRPRRARRDSRALIGFRPFGSEPY